MSEEKKIENVRTTQHKVVFDSPSPFPYERLDLQISSQVISFERSTLWPDL